MRSVFKAVPLIAAALLLTSVVPDPATAGGYGHSKHGPYHYPYKGHHGSYYYGHRPYYYHEHYYRPKHVYIVPRPVYVTPPPVYVYPQPVYQEDYRWRRPPPNYAATWQGQGEKIYYEEPTPQGPAATCLMTREYQTQVVVGGQSVPGYGYACLQPDGSWYRGPAVPINSR